MVNFEDHKAKPNQLAVQRAEYEKIWVSRHESTTFLYKNHITETKA